MTPPIAPVVIGRPNTALFLDLDAYNGVTADATVTGPWNWTSSSTGAQRFYSTTNNFSPTFSASSFDGKPAFTTIINRRFATSSPTADVTSAVSGGAVTFIMVLRPASLPGAGSSFYPFGASSNGGFAAQLMPDGSLLLARQGQAGLYNTTAGAIAANTKYIVIISFRPGGATTIRINGVQMANGGTNVTASGVNAGPTLSIAANGPAGTSTDFVGQIASMLIPQGGALTQADEIAWEQYLNSRWGAY